jgi:hypothetical protein
MCIHASLFEGDMMVTKSAIKANYGETFSESLEAGGFIFFPEDSSSGRNLGTITKQRWPNRVNGVTTIAYIFQDGLDETRKVAARAAHVILEKSGVVNFVERTFENEVFFIGNYDSESCYVRLGYNPGYPGVINLGWCNDLQEGLGGGSIDYLTLAPGLYKWSTNVNFPNKLTFSGRATDVWILQIAGILYIGSGAEVLLAGGARAENILWQVFGLVDVDTTAHLEGIFLVKTHMAFKIGSSLTGAALAQTAVTLDDADIIKESSIEGAAAGPVA